MPVLVECVCHKKQSLKNKICSCGQPLDKLKKAGKASYWIAYRLPGGKQRFEKITGENANSIEYAKDVLSKRRVQKRERRPVFEILPQAEMTFRELTDWFLSLESVKAKKYYPILQLSLKKFNAVFGERIVCDIKPSELEDYRARRRQEGKAESTIDQEIGAAKVVVNKAFLDRKVAGDVLLNFKSVKKYLTGKRRNSNARKRVLSHGEFLKILDALPFHSKGIFLTGYYTGMRLGEILKLTWDMVSLKEKKIVVPKEITKDHEDRVIPICDPLFSFLKRIPIPIHEKHVFLNNGKPIKDIRTGLKRACRVAGVVYGRFEKDGFVEHDLRHTFITNMRRAGVHNDVTNAITGHSEGSMRSRYDTVSFEDMMDGVRRLEDYLSKELAKSGNFPENVYQTVYQVPIFGENQSDSKSSKLLKSFGAEGGT